VHFLYKSELTSFSLLTFGFVTFWRKNICAKFGQKMLMKLRPEEQTKQHAATEKADKLTHTHTDTHSHTLLVDYNSKLIALIFVLQTFTFE